LRCFDQVLEQRPGDGLAALGRGRSLGDIGAFTQATEIIERIFHASPNEPAAAFFAALDRLLRGQLADGFRAYEARAEYMSTPHDLIQERPGLPWRGEHSLDSKTLLVHWEQGLGDTIQFCRYVPMLQDFAARVVFEVQAPLYRLLQTLEGRFDLVVAGETPSGIDFKCPLLSLPLVFGTTLDSIPSKPRYLSADQGSLAKWERLLGGRDGRPRIGVVWHGNVQNSRDGRRSIPLWEFIKALPVGPDYVSLQYEIRSGDELVLMARPDIRYIGQDLVDFADTAAVVEQLDLVISVDTSVAHLAGALGKPTWLLVDFVPDWRWLLERRDSPWYASVRLYRQTKRGDWSSPLALVRQDIEASLDRDGFQNADTLGRRHVA
jgi:hypothetical protein